MTDKTYPIAEMFHSLQGEGVFTGTPMLFVRLAGCNVGEYIGYPTGAEDATQFLAAGPFIMLDDDLGLLKQKRHSVCTTASGEKFLCDTDYHASEQKSVDELVSSLEGEQHVCITGGEPFLHNLTPLVLAFQEKGVMVHIETSGTKPLIFEGVEPRYYGDFRSMLWITLAPKKGLLPAVINDVHEIKILVGDGIDEKWLSEFIRTCELSRFGLPQRGHGGRIFLQPINGVDVERDDSLRVCLDLLKRFPALRLSAQLHKYLHQR